MSLLTAFDLASLQATAADVRVETIIIQRVTRTPDTYGGWSESWATLATVTGRLRVQPGREGPVADRLTAVTVYQVSLPAGTDVTPRDRLVVSGRTFEVTGVATPKSDEVVRRVTALEVA